MYTITMLPSQIVKSPTHSSHASHSSTIDLVLVSNPNNVKSCTVIPELANSDHLGLFVTMNQTQCVKANTITRKVWRYLQADFDRVSKIIDTIDWEAELNSDDIDHIVTAWNTSFMQIMELSKLRERYHGLTRKLSEKSVREMHSFTELDYRSNPVMQGSTEGKEIMWYPLYEKAKRPFLIN